MKFFENELAGRALPLSANPEQSASFISGWQAEHADGPLANKAIHPLLECLSGNSPYLSGLISKHPEVLEKILDKGFDASFKTMMDELGGLEFSASREQIMAALRKAKSACALIIALADIYDCWPLEKITLSLSQFADAALQKSVDHLLLKAEQAGNISLKDNEKPSADSGVIVVGVGKLGSLELNYSSDIDIIFFYDADKVNYTGRTTISQFFVRFAQDVTQIMQERTKDGYVFRTDLRLRPDPGSTPAAISVKAAEYYYETVGQNWERAAMIKARPVAGDIKAGKSLMQFLGTYIWRKYLDFASIQDIHSIKRQINSKVGKLPKDLLGYNVKLGHGGIREIEFYAQTQQLIWGGREPALRLSATCDALKMLTEIGQSSPEALQELSDAYRFYRTVEHRLQMVADQQTHTLPETPDEMERFAIFMGFKTREAFIKKMHEHLKKVQAHYGKLFESSPSLASEAEGSLVFTGVEDDPETIETLKKMGFQNPGPISETIRGWHHGRRRATRTKRARELLTELMPVLLKALAKTASPDVAFTRFDEFLSRLPAGVQIFSLFYAQPHLLDLIAEIMGGYPYVAENLSRKPALIEYMLSQEFFSDLPDVDRFKERLEIGLKQARDYEDVLDITRAWTHDRQFRVGIQLIKRQITPAQASIHLSSIADAALSTLLHYVLEDFMRQHGKIKDDVFAVIAMGKLGGKEITFASDIDLVFVYDPDAYPKNMNLSASDYFIRLSRRFISAITSLTPEGMLYQIDTRLRPSGNDGPIACSLEALDKYYGSANDENKAWEWEYMALTRARIISGGKTISNRIEDIIRKKIQTKWDISLLAQKVVEMRERIEQSGHKTDNIFKIKHVRGGLIDLEFTAQFLQLIHALKHPEAPHQNTRQALENLISCKVLGPKDGKDLLTAYTLYHNLQSILRLTGNKNPEEAAMSNVTRHILSQAAGCKDFNELKKSLVASQKKVQNLFDKFITAHA